MRRARRRCRRCGTSVEPFCGAEDRLPIKVAGLDLADGGVAAVGAAGSGAHAEAALSKVEAVAHGAADAVVRDPPESEVSTPPWRMKSSTRRPTGLSASAVAMAVRRPKQRRRPRATLYSPPPSHTWKWRVVWMRPSPGSRRSMTSPRLRQSQRRLESGIESGFMVTEYFSAGGLVRSVSGCRRDRARDGSFRLVLAS